MGSEEEKVAVGREVEREGGAMVAVAMEAAEMAAVVQGEVKGEHLVEVVMERAEREEEKEEGMEEVATVEEMDLEGLVAGTEGHRLLHLHSSVQSASHCLSRKSSSCCYHPGQQRNYLPRAHKLPTPRRTCHQSRSLYHERLGAHRVCRDARHAVRKRCSHHARSSTEGTQWCLTI